MVGFLLDCNHLDAFCRKDARVVERLKKAPAEWWVFTSAITLGEVDAGHRMTTTTNHLRREEYEKCIDEHFAPYALEVTAKTRTYYGRIMGKIWRDHTPPHGKETEKWLVENGVDVNDVWFIAVAWEHQIIAVTSDGMEWIKKAVGRNVKFENWLGPPAPSMLMKFLADKT